MVTPGGVVDGELTSTSAEIVGTDELVIEDRASL